MSSLVSERSPSSQSYRMKTGLWMVLAVLLFGVANIVFAERLTYNGGFGWDGQNYGSWAKDFYNAVFVSGLSEYYVQRILPSGIVHYGARAVLSLFYSSDNIAAILQKNENIILCFDIYNLFLLCIAAFIWNLIADEIKIDVRGKWLGLCFLFVNYAVLKMNFYHSVLTDTTAFFLGFLMFYFYVTDRYIAMPILIVAGGFVWPTLPYMAAILYCFPFRGVAASNPALSTSSKRVSDQWPAILLMGISAIAFVFAVPKIPEYSAFPHLRVDMTLLPLSIAAVLVYIYLGAKILFSAGGPPDPKAYWSATAPIRIVVAAGLLIALKLAIHFLAKKADGFWGSLDSFVIYTYLSSATEPFIFLVAHVVYYGPAIVLLALLWKPFCIKVSEYGPGMILLIAVNLVLSIGPQSRYQIIVVSTFFIILVSILTPSFFTKVNMTVIVVLGLLWSKVWYTFNMGPQVFDGTMDSLLKFPMQHFFMNSGPWMSYPMYLVHAGCVILTAVICALLLWGRRNVVTADAAGIRLSVARLRRHTGIDMKRGPDQKAIG